MNQGSAKANKILEINPEHELFKALVKVYDDKKDIKEYATLLYDQALLFAGLPIEDTLAYTKRISDLMLKAMN